MGGQTQSPLALLCIGEVGESRPRVVMLGLERGEPPRLVLSAQLRLGPLGQREVPVGMTAPGLVRIELLQPLRGVLPHGLEQVVPGLAFRPPYEEERCVREALDEIDGPRLVSGQADLRHCRERRAAAEHGKAGEHSSLVIREQVVAPVERLVQRLLARREVVRAAGEKPQPLRQPVEHGLRTERADARRRELDGEREAVDAPADLADGAAIIRRDPEVGLERAGALLEKRLRRLGVERGNREDVLARQMEHRPARDEQRQAGRASEKLDECRSRLAQVLGVVEDQQELARAQGLGERLERALRVGDAERLGDRRDDQLGLAERRQLHEHGTVRVRGRGGARGLESQPRLAASACAGEDEEPDVAASEERGEGVEVRLAPDERIRRLGQCASDVVGGRDVERRILLEDPPLQIAELRPRLEPELVGEPAANGRIVLERLRLPSRAVQRQHRELLQSFPQWILAREGEDLAERFGLSAELELRAEALLEGDQPQLLEPLALGLEEVAYARSAYARPRQSRDACSASDRARA